MSPSSVLAARNAVGAVFVLNGVLFATLVSRLPAIRDRLDLDNGALGLLLLASAAGSVLALPATGHLVQRFGVRPVIRAGALLVGAGLVGAGLGAAVAGSAAACAVALLCHGVGNGTWDVAMNVEGADVERRLARTVMPRFHAGWSIGSVLGAGIGVLAAAAAVPVSVHLGLMAVLAVALTWRAAGTFGGAAAPEPAAAGSVARSPLAAWREPRTLAIGVVVLAFATVEGTANDWLALALIDGHDAPEWVGTAGFAVFVVAMTTGRLVGPALLDRCGRVVALRATAVAAATGVLLVVLADHPVPVVAGILLWGLGAALGFPVGMSAAADRAEGAAARVSVVATIGYGAFLAGPPLLGLLGDRVGTLDALLVPAVLMVPAALAVQALRPAGR